MEKQAEILRDVCFFIAQECDASSLNAPYSFIQKTKAKFWYDQGLRLDPNNPELHYAASYVAMDNGDYAGAIEHCTAAMASQHPEHAIMAQYNRGLLHLMLKDYVKGFEDYDARLRIPLNKSSRIARFGDLPYWNGEDCHTLHISGEQGFGDIFQFCRYVPLIKRGFAVSRILFEVPKSLRRFFQYNFRRSPEIEVVSEQWHPKVDYHIQLVSLARIFGTTYDFIPPLKLEAEPEFIEKWHHSIEKWHPSSAEFKVAFNHTARADDNDMQVTEWNSRRQIHPDKFHSIFDGAPCLRIPLQPADNPNIKDWSDTAGILANMDLAVSIDSGPVHLAAAMGVPTWLLNHKRCCWRWGLEGLHTVWYGDNLIIIRQQKEGDWEPVITGAREMFQMAVDKKEGRLVA